MALSGDSKILACGDCNATIRLWQLENQELWKTLETKTCISAIAFSPDNRWLVATGGYSANDNMVCLWDIDTGKLLQMLIDGISIGDYYLVYAAIFSTDGEKLYVATSNGIQCWHKNPSAGMQNTID